MSFDYHGAPQDEVHPIRKRLCHRRNAHGLRLAAMLGIFACVVSACGNTAAPTTIKSPVCAGECVALVTFLPDTPYAQALRLVTDLGFQPRIACGVAVPWQPMGQVRTYSTRHALLIVPVYTLVADWLSQLQNQKLVEHVTMYGGGGAPPGYSCPSRGTPLTLTAGQADVLTNIHFVTPLNSYDAALAVISNLGLALNAGCVKTIAGANAEQSAHTAGEEAYFAQTSALVAQPMPQAAATTWRQQLGSISGVGAIQSYSLQACN